MKGLVPALVDLVPAGRPAPAALRERLMASIARPELRFAPLYGPLVDLFDLTDHALRDVFIRAAAPEAWAAAPVPDTWLFHLQGGPRVAGADNGLVKIRAGARFPRHTHLGRERVLVLEGSYREDPSGRLYQAGDLHEMPEGSVHAYVASPERDLLLAVSLVRGVDVEGFGPLSPATT